MASHLNSAGGKQEGIRGMPFHLLLVWLPDSRVADPAKEDPQGQSPGQVNDERDCDECCLQPRE